MRAAPLAALLLLCSSCVQLQWTRDRYYDPIPLERLDDFQIDACGLGRCLQKLGAPHTVSKGPDEGVDLIYAWTDDVSWGFTVSYDLTSWVTASFSYADRDEALQGVLFRFSDDLVLREKRYGRLNRIITGGRDQNRDRRSGGMPDGPTRPQSIRPRYR